MHPQNNKTKQWKSFAQLAKTSEAQRWEDDEFPHREGLLDLDRRDFLKVAGAGMALAGLSGCRILPQPTAVPYVRAPEELTPGRSLHYATTLPIHGFGVGVLVRSYEGRPVKIEGNPEHPASRGATDMWTQAELLNLYDPDRASSVIENGEIRSWDQFAAAVRPVLKRQKAKGGSGIRILTEVVTSPAVAGIMAKFEKAFPNAKWHQWEPLNQSNVRKGTMLAFGKPLTPVYQLDKAKIIVTLDADVLLTMPGSVVYARQFAEGRRVREASQEMNRLYAIESSYTITGASADHRLALSPSGVEGFARALYAKVTGSGSEQLPTGADDLFLETLVADLSANSGAAVVVPGDEASSAIHALAHGINAALQAIGKTVTYHAPIEVASVDPAESLEDLAKTIHGGGVELLLVLGGNPVYTAPGALKLKELFLTDKCPLRVHLSRYEDETSEVCQWHLPESHPLETWGDTRAFDGTIGLTQPLLYPLYGTRSVLETVSLLLEQALTDHELVRQQYANLSEAAWRKAVHDGVLQGSAAPAVAVVAKTGLLTALPAQAKATGLEVNFRPDPSVWDGRDANNSWLQELPKPITTIVWDNAAVVSPATAKTIGVIPETGESDAVNIAQYTGKRLVEIKVGNASVKVPVWILPGQPDNTITLYLGYGRTQGGNVGVGQGVSVYPILSTDNASYLTGASATVTGETYELVFTQPHHLMRTEIHSIGAVEERENRDIVRSASLDRFKLTKGHVHEGHEAVEPKILDRVSGSNEPAEGHGEGEHGEPASKRPTVTADHAAGLGRNQWEYLTENPEAKHEANKEGFESLYPEYSRKNYNAWAMSIDLTTCIGCNVCTIACQAENNIPTVGKGEVKRGREMHWIRIDHYFETTDLKDVESHFMPVPCMQCEKAPCEPVCPVAATVHSHEGLNQMVYNRCVGTRYCSNNCPYKVRRFNFLKWTQGVGGPTTLDFFKERTPLKMLPNPDVTVRGRGVMEKCTYCVQRINEVRIEAKKEGREIQDGEVVTACQQACPTQAIVFGDINNPNSKVSQLKHEPHDYALLAELNTRPRTTYLAKIKNPNPALTKVAAGEGGHA